MIAKKMNFCRRFTIVMQIISMLDYLYNNTYYCVLFFFIEHEYVISKTFLFMYYFDA